VDDDSARTLRQLEREREREAAREREKWERGGRLLAAFAHARHAFVAN